MHVIFEVLEKNDFLLVVVRIILNGRITCMNDTL
jgi:hypothetical protein